MRHSLIAILIFFLANTCSIAQEIDTIQIIDFIKVLDPNSSYNEILKLKSEQGQLSDCEFATRNAIIDFDKACYSFHSQEFYPPECTYCDVLDMDYNVKWYFVDNSFSEEYYDCYNSIMTIKLKTIYGQDFLKKASEKADSLEKTTNWRKDAQFPGGEMELLKFIYTKLKVDPNYNKSIKTRIIVHIEIDTTGQVINPEIFRGINKEIDDNVISIMKSNA